MSDTDLLLPEPGSSAYMPTLIRTLLDHPALEEWRFDPTLFSLLFLGLVVRKGGIIVDIPGSRKGVGEADIVANSIHAMAESIFGLDALSIHLDEPVTPQRAARMVLDRRKRHLVNPQQAPSNQNQWNPPANIVPEPLKSGSSTRYHCAESVLRPRHHPLDSPGIKALSADPRLQSSSRSNADADKEYEREQQWPDVLVITGLEHCGSPVQNKLCELVKRSAKDRDNGGGTLLIWVRNEDASERTPSWLVDNFVLSGTVDPDELEQPPQLGRQALIPLSYITDITDLLPYTHIHPTLTQHLNNLISATSAHPSLQSILTGRFFMTLPVLVKAHRLLSSPFHLPTDWRTNLARVAQPDHGDTQRFGLGGGQGGVNGWARRAGEEPNLAELGGDGDEWYVSPENIKGIWATAVRHRVRWRDEGESVMWAITTSAAELLDKQREAEAADAQIQRRRARQKREEVDAILDDMLDML